MKPNKSLILILLSAAMFAAASCSSDHSSDVLSRELFASPESLSLWTWARSI